MDCAAETLSELLLTTHPTNIVYHLENPIRQSWRDVLTVLAAQMNIPNADLLPFDNWLEAVCAITDGVTDENPAKKLAEFFKMDFIHMACGNVILDTKRAREVSPTLRGMGTISNETIAAYVDHWRSVGFLK